MKFILYPNNMSHSENAYIRIQDEEIHIKKVVQEIVDLRRENKDLRHQIAFLEANSNVYKKYLS